MVERKIKEIKENKIIDIFNGDFIQIWKDDDFFYFSTPYAVLNFTEEDWIEFKKDIDESKEKEILDKFEKMIDKLASKVKAREVDIGEYDKFISVHDLKERLQKLKGAEE